MKPSKISYKVISVLTAFVVILAVEAVSAKNVIKDCPVQGFVGAKSYEVMPTATKILLREGDDHIICFDSETEAIQAGFRKK